MDGGAQSNNSNFSGCHFLIFVTADFHQCFFDMCSKKTGKEESLQSKVLLPYTSIITSFIPQNKRVQVSSVLIDLRV